jgi:hypothetical protein
MSDLRKPLEGVGDLYHESIAAATGQPNQSIVATQEHVRVLGLGSRHMHRIRRLEAELLHFFGPRVQVFR